MLVQLMFYIFLNDINYHIFTEYKIFILNYDYQNYLNGESGSDQALKVFHGWVDGG